MRQCFHYQAWHMEPPIWRKETLKIEEKCFLLQIADHANTIERYGQFLRHVSHSGSLHLYYDGTGIVKILLFGACSRDVWAGADEACADWWTVGVECRPDAVAVGHGCRDN